MSDSSTGAQPGDRIPALDGLRAIAILLVMPHNIDVFEGRPTPLELPAVVYTHGGWIGVQLFFVLSGFLITGALLDTRTGPNYFRNFFARRAARILPLYFAALALFFVVLPLLHAQPAELSAHPQRQFWLWTFTSNWSDPFTGGMHGFTHFWSLAVEEQFYLLWPLVVLGCTPRRLIQVCAGLIVVAIAARLALHAAQFQAEAIYTFTFCRMDALALGALVACAHRSPQIMQRLRGSAGLIAAASLAILMATALGTKLFAVYGSGSQTLGYSLLALGFALAVLATLLPTPPALRGASALLAARPLALIARYSYGMYVIHPLLHFFVGIALLHHFVVKVGYGEALLYMAIVIVVTFALAALSYELFERRFLKSRRELRAESA